MSPKFDITIIGGGPAGATLARLLSDQYRVLLVDKRALDRAHDDEKCCGGLLAPDAQKVLARLGLGIPQHILTGPQPFAVKTLDWDNHLIRYYQRHYINIDREKFDVWLNDLIPDNVTKWYGCNYLASQFEEGFHSLKLRRNGEKITVKSKILVGADGALSRVRKNGFPNQDTPQKYGSIQEWFTVEQSLPFSLSVFDEEVTDFYSWAIQKNNQLIIGSAIPVGQNPADKFNLLKDKLRAKGIDLGEPDRRHGTLIFRPTKASHFQIGNHETALIGEAAGFISPSSAEGISYALKSAISLSEALNKSLDEFFPHYQKCSKKLCRNLRLKHWKSKIMYSKTLRKIIMKLGLLAIKPVRSED